MKKLLERNEHKELYHYADGVCVDGSWSAMSGNCSGLSGDCSGLSGNCSNLSGDCSNLWGDCSNLRGNCSDLSGNLDSCEITEEERKEGIKITDLIKE